MKATKTYRAVIVALAAVLMAEVPVHATGIVIAGEAVEAVSGPAGVPEESRFVRGERRRNVAMFTGTPADFDAGCDPLPNLLELSTECVPRPPPDREWQVWSIDRPWAVRQELDLVEAQVRAERSPRPSERAARWLAAVWSAAAAVIIRADQRE